MRQLFASFSLLAALAAAPKSQADPVLDWNGIATQTIIAAGRPGPSGVIDFAVVHGAIHDAVQAYEKRFEPYATELTGAGSEAAAVAKATRDILVNRFPGQQGTVDALYSAYLAAIPVAPDDPGVAVGAAAAAGMIQLRMNDGAFPNPPPVFNGSMDLGMWRPTPSLQPGPPPGGLSMAAPWLAETTPFVVLSGDQFMNDRPLELGTPQYRKDYNEVKTLGARFGSTRTPDQTQIAFIWADNFFAQMNRILVQLAENKLASSGDRARMLALVWLAAADGVINTWTSKIAHPTWRPITAITLDDGDPKTKGDVDWQPLINTPNYPEHSSGANAFVGGAMKMLALYFETEEMTFTVTSNNPNASPGTRTYHHFFEAARDVVEARILQGIHFRTSDKMGRKLGQRVSKWVFRNALRPLDGSLDGGYEDEEENEDEDED